MTHPKACFRAHQGEFKVLYNKLILHWRPDRCRDPRASDVEVIDANYINKAYTRMLKSEVKYRFVIDIASIKQKKAEVA